MTPERIAELRNKYSRHGKWTPAGSRDINSVLDEIDILSDQVDHWEKRCLFAEQDNARLHLYIDSLEKELESERRGTKKIQTELNNIKTYIEEGHV